MPATAPVVSAARPAFTERRFVLTFVFVALLFLLWGVAITMGDVLNRHFQSVLHVSKADSGLVQFSIFGAYALMGVPAGLFMQRFGYKSGVLLGLALYAAGAFLFIPAADAGSFLFFRGALFVLACGLATLETVAHPFIAALGDQRSSDQRINFAQSFNGLGAVIGPLIGGYFILRASQGGAQEGLQAVKTLYFVIGSVILAVAVGFALVRVPPLPTDPHAAELAPGELPALAADTPSLFSRRHFRWAVAAQFFNAAAQGGTWAFFINYGVEKMGLSAERAAYFFAFSMVLMMVGRFIGTALMRVIAPARLLAIAAAANIVLCLIIAQGWGAVSFGALLLLNFFFSIMFPTVFSLGLKDLGPRTQQGSSFIITGVVGAAVFPYLMGQVANHNIAAAYYLPIICYAVILLFGAKYYKVQPR
ncbi:L-fucose:H+ symporter permease [Hymenobacter sp. BT186]|uniref:L-fucose:H+ symporter permease n=1 Tax=Hymenobacter telluris TaxID=2816474 RepID=A0A939JBE5_9BACT|nr:L-fucose:H+ symporter permease [Hymenobacter telluris]MBO0356713.1 L-fucose:H+ symporter permease [Hymenobacter telluris]MBW3372738.1 L-fucose:H+ symporter permease [Hymenobacter norwichensis]